MECVGYSVYWLYRVRLSGPHAILTHAHVTPRGNKKEKCKEEGKLAYSEGL